MLLLGFLGIAAAVGLAGCGEPTGVIEGRVTDAGQPVPLAQIQLQPVEAGEDSRGFLGETVSDGRYFMETIAGEGMPVGRYRAVVTYHVLKGGGALPGGESGAAAISDGRALRRRVALEVEVKEGRSNLDFDLSKGELLEEVDPAAEEE
jgi:hypothetical protein